MVNAVTKIGFTKKKKDVEYISPCRGLSAEEEVVLLHLLDVKMFLKKQELKERMTSARKKSLGSVSSLSQAILYPSICQV